MIAATAPATSGATGSTQIGVTSSQPEVRNSA
ncbi:hypothetical protein JOH48_001629 [Bradyrhizobium elkanii]|nr:hypothetical protein [Bradyrhizobium elkanii]